MVEPRHFGVGVAASGALLLVVVMLWATGGGEPAPPPVAVAAPRPAAHAPPGIQPVVEPQAALPQALATPASAPRVLGPSPGNGKMFSVDQAGHLLLDERMRLALENLVVLTPPEQLESLLDGQLAGLPPHAAAAARDLVSRYQGYEQAQKLSSSSAKAPLVPEEGLAELDELSAMRQSYFGRDAAKRLFGDEEAVTRRLLELMRDDPIPHASMEDKAVRAQARYDSKR